MEKYCFIIRIAGYYRGQAATVALLYRSPDLYSVSRATATFYRVPLIGVARLLFRVSRLRLENFRFMTGRRIVDVRPRGGPWTVTLASLMVPVAPDDGLYR